MAGYQIGEQVRLIQVPPYLYRDDPVDAETARFFERCVGHVFRVEYLDKDGQLELWVTDAGEQSPDRLRHTIWIEPEYVEAFSASEPEGDPQFEAQARQMVQWYEFRHGRGEEPGASSGVRSPVAPPPPEREAGKAHPLPEHEEPEA